VTSAPVYVCAMILSYSDGTDRGKVMSRGTYAECSKTRDVLNAVSTSDLDVTKAELVVLHEVIAVVFGWACSAFPTARRRRGFVGLSRLGWRRETLLTSGSRKRATPCSRAEPRSNRYETQNRIRRTAH
jgi:hypothetical protein